MDIPRILIGSAVILFGAYGMYLGYTEPSSEVAVVSALILAAGIGVILNLYWSKIIGV